MEHLKLSIIELKKRKAKHDHNRYQKLRANQIITLGSKCVACGKPFTSFTYDLLEIHHVIPYNKRSRTRAKSYFSTDPKLVEIRCKDICHADTPNYRKKNYKVVI